MILLLFIGHNSDGTINAKYPIFDSINLESGLSLNNITISYQTWGELSPSKDNVILICHHLTGNQYAADTSGETPIEGWWRDVIGPGKVIDTTRYFVICSSVLGGCVGSTGPMSFSHEKKADYRLDFPAITIRDMVVAQEKLLRSLGVSNILAVVGPSLGGMQAIEWGVMFPEFTRQVISLGAPFVQTPWSIAWNEMARLAIMGDPAWQNGNYIEQPKNGLSLSRYPFVLSCTHPDKCNNSLNKSVDNISAKLQFDQFPAQKYLKYHCDKFDYDANSLIYLINAVNGHDITRRRESICEKINNSQVQFTLIGISNDMIYFPKRFEKRSGLLS
ncbi:homoserine O-acetyltransferase family protein [Piscirickettsia litoralis]|uniref:Probable acyltransferase n=1 Tax=Piscirickettsia litoralis TaxID=1891921 RepID=A0ABX3A351_9GAMM|nr:homoserine O-acetyltransferase [Piscirickettsia litoralis]ODN43292.1 homoserine O-acetyltransferase [Piscirickettsia litoralis]